MTSKKSDDASVITQNHPDLNQLNSGPPKSALTRSLGFMSLFCLCLALIIHFLTIFSLFPFGKDFLIIQIAIIAIVYIFAILSSFLNRDTSTMKVLNLFPNLSTFFIGVVLVVYAVINFATFIPSVTQVDQKNGKYYSYVRYSNKFRGGPQKAIEISESEFIASQNNWARASSGHWLIIFYLPTVYFLFKKETGKA